MAAIAISDSGRGALRGVVLSRSSQAWPADFRDFVRIRWKKTDEPSNKGAVLARNGNAPMPLATIKPLEVATR
jgi:hypothetical protein